MKVGNRIFYKDEPVMYFDTLKTSSLEAASATVYAQGGRGNPRLIAWDGDRTLTFNMEDALISSEGLQILAGAGLLEASSKETLKVHTTSQLSGNDIITHVTGSGSTAYVDSVSIVLPQKPYWALTSAGKVDPTSNYIYVMVLDEYGEVFSEPFIPNVGTVDAPVDPDEAFVPVYWDGDSWEEVTSGSTEKVGGYKITADKFGGSFYIEADTLFRTQQGLDMPAEFFIPNGKIQSNFTLSMAATGDPSTFTFTVDAMPDYTRFDRSKKVLAAVQIIQDGAVSDAARERTYTAALDVDTSIL